MNKIGTVRKYFVIVFFHSFCIYSAWIELYFIVKWIYFIKFISIFHSSECSQFGTFIVITKFFPEMINKRFFLVYRISVQQYFKRFTSASTCGSRVIVINIVCLQIIKIFFDHFLGKNWYFIQFVYVFEIINTDISFIKYSFVILCMFICMY